MSELTVTALRLGYLALIWLVVVFALRVLRSDIYGTKVTLRGRRQPSSRRPNQPAYVPPQGEWASPNGPVETPASGTRIASHLVVVSGPLKGAQVPLSKSGILIGRDPSCTLVLDDDYSSNRHARIFPQVDGWYVEDLGSTNGTFLRNEPVEKPTLVPLGAPIQVGQSVIELRR